MNDEGRISGQLRPGGAGTSRWLAALLLTIPVIVVIGFAGLVSPPGRMFELGSPTPAPVASDARQPQADVEQMVERLATRLKSQPDDVRGWNTLAHSYYVLGRFAEAAGAYERLLALTTPDAETLADYADALAMAQGRSLAGKPMELVRQAIALNPAHWKALSMAGTEAFQRGDAKAAIEYWSRARAAVPADSDNARMLDANLAQARQISAQQPAQATSQQR